MVELLVVIRMVDNPCLLGPECGGSAAVKVNGISHSQHVAYIGCFIYGCTVCLALEATIDYDKIGIPLIIVSKSSTRMSLVIELCRSIVRPDLGPLLLLCLIII